MIQKSSNYRFTKDNVDNLYQTLLSIDKNLNDSFERYLLEEYNDDISLRLNHVDIGEISRYIVDQLKMEQTEHFQLFFEKVEEVLESCDSDIENLIVIGLFEGIQNIGGCEINYYSSFDKWLGPLSKTKWDELINFWEGKPLK